jgi:hypothetical protein
MFSGDFINHLVVDHRQTHYVQLVPLVLSLGDGEKPVDVRG